MEAMSDLTAARVDAGDLYEMRLIFEPEAAYYAAKRATDRELERILELGEQVEERIREGKDRKAVEQELCGNAHGGCYGRNCGCEFRLCLGRTAGVAEVDKLLNRGGMTSMMEIICLILISISFAGIVEKSGMVSTVIERALKNAKKDSAVITATLLSTIFTNFATGVQYVALIIPGRMFKDIYKERGLHQRTCQGLWRIPERCVLPLFRGGQMQHSYQESLG